MVNSKGKRPDYCSEVADELLCEFYLRFTIRDLPEGKEERSIYAPPFLELRSHEKTPPSRSGLCFAIFTWTALALAPGY